MSKPAKWGTGLVAALATLLCSLTAAAQGLLLSPSDLPDGGASLSAEIQAARQRDPVPFDRLGQVRAELPSLDAHKRGPYPVITPQLTALGPDGALPIIERLVFDGEPRNKLSDNAWSAWRASLVEALGRLADSRSEPLLAAILDGPVTDPLVVYATTAAYGTLATDAVAADLLGRSYVVDDKQLPILGAMGHCRRLIVAERLAEALATTADPETALVLARALGDVGSAWAWQVPSTKHRYEEMWVRFIAAEALIDAAAWFEDEVRRKITAAILVVDSPETPWLIQDARRQVPPDRIPALDELAKRFANSPFHRTPSKQTP